MSGDSAARDGEPRPPPSPSRRVGWGRHGSFLGGLRQFSSCPQVPAAEAEAQASVAEWGSPLLGPHCGGRPCLGLRMLILGPETHLPRMPGEASPRPRHVPLQVGLSLRSWPGPQLRPHPEASFEPRALSGQGRPCWEATGRSRRTPDHRPGDWARPHASPGGQQRED